MFWRTTWPALGWALLILILCGMPGDKLPEMSFLEWLKPDKIVHLFLFGVQSFLLIRSFRKLNNNPVVYKNAVVLSLVITITYGCIVEIMQTFIFIHRSGDIRDAFANSIGAFTGWWIYKKYIKTKLPDEA